MARATRSSATQLQDKQPDPPRTKPSTKKRKRTSDGDHPTPKQLRIKEENGDDNPNRAKLQSLQLAADVPIDPSDAQQILDILDL